MSQLKIASIEETGFTDVVETSKMLMGALSQIGLSAAISAAYNSTDSQFNVTGITTNSSVSGMVSNSERVRIVLSIKYIYAFEICEQQA
jgi:hypothetical protein